MPWEETDQYIRSGHRDASAFEPDSLRTITLSEEEGVKAVVGKPKGKDTTEVQSYLFDKDKWTLEKAKAWFQQHHREAVREHVSWILPFHVLEKIVDKPLRISGVALTAGMSRNLNIYTEQELQNFANKLVAAPVYIEHVAVPNAVGRVTKTRWDPESRTLFYEAEIYDDETAEKIRKGLIQHVSVGADYERIDILDGKVPHGLHNAELSLVAVPGIPQTNIQVMEKLNAKPAVFPLHSVALVNDFKVDGKEYITPGEYILGFHRDPYSVLPEHFSTIWLDRENGILALVGMLRNQPESKRIQSILFAKDKTWDEPKIRDWFLLHPHYLIESKDSAPIGDPACQTPSREHRLSEEMSEQNQAEQEEEHTCPVGYVWDAEQQKCVPKTEVEEQQGQEKPKCPEGQVWDPEQQKCVPEKQPEQPQVQERVWTRNYVNNLPDSAFAITLPGGEKDEENKTSPRTLRKFPHHNANGSIDLPHLRNANARVPQSDLTAEQKEQAMRHLARHKKAAGIGVTAEEAKLLEQEQGEEGEVPEVEAEIAPEPSMDELIASVEDIVSQINDAIEALTARVEKLEQAVQKPEGEKSVAEELLKAPRDPNLIDKREILKLIPEQRIVRSWSYGPRKLVNQLRYKLSQSSKDRE